MQKTEEMVEMSEKKRPVAVIDSGLGGISVLNHLLTQLPNEDFVYFGDTANAPYGSKNTEDVLELTVRNIRMLSEKYFAKAVVIACNTATGAAAEKCRELFNRNRAGNKACGHKKRQGRSQSACYGNTFDTFARKICSSRRKV